MKSQNKGLIFCLINQQIQPIDSITLKNFTLFNLNYTHYLETFFFYLNKEELIKVKRFYNRYKSFIIAPKKTNFQSSIKFLFSYNNKIKFKSGRKIYGNINLFNFHIVSCNYCLYYSENIFLRNSSNTFENILTKWVSKKNGNKKLNQIFITATSENFEKVTNAVKRIKDNIFSNFSSKINSFFNDVVVSIQKKLSRREIGNEIQIVGIKTKSDSALVIDIPYEKITVTEFIRKLGLDNFNSNYLEVSKMIEAMRMYELGETLAFKEYTTYAVNHALKAIERKLFELDEDARNIALIEMNNLDSLKFIVELITDDELLECYDTQIEIEQLTLPQRT
jgi:hypothetical protein